MEEESLSPQESLVLIQSMIDKTKASVADNSFYFLLWGWLVFIASIGQYVLKVVFNSPWHPIVWSINILGLALSVYHGIKEEKKRRVKNYVDESLGHLWIAIIAAYVLFG